MNIFIAMSGGVDSSVAAAILKEQGHSVTGITMRLFKDAPTEDAQEVAASLGIPHHIVDFQEVFESGIIQNFVSEYAIGHTPNPCVRCNRLLKFGLLLDKAREMGADAMATGHYARVEWGIMGNRGNTGNIPRAAGSIPQAAGQIPFYSLKKGIDSTKDQSYFLWTLTQEQLKYIVFPLGEMTKDQVRQKATELRLDVAEKPESQEICFILGDDYRSFLRECAVKDQPGNIIDTKGNILGDHTGISGFTIGQRRGLGIAAENPLYVIALDVANNAVIVGDESETFVKSCIVKDINVISGAPLSALSDVSVQIRYNAPATLARLTPLDDSSARLDFAEPQRGVAPGQSAVFYDADTVIAGSLIS